MAKFSDAHKRITGKGPQEEPDKPPVQLDDLPNLSMVLLGYEEKPGVFVKGMSITLWWMDGKLKFSINDKATGYVGFAVVKGDLPLGEAIELAIEGEEIEWKDMSDSRKRH